MSFPRFFDLPYDVRDLIYQQSLKPSVTLNNPVPAIAGPVIIFRSAKIYNAPVTALLLANKTINTEYNETLRRKMKLHMDYTIRDDSSAGTNGQYFPVLQSLDTHAVGLPPHYWQKLIHTRLWFMDRTRHTVLSRDLFIAGLADALRCLPSLKVLELLVIQDWQTTSYRSDMLHFASLDHCFVGVGKGQRALGDVWVKLSQDLICRSFSLYPRTTHSRRDENSAFRSPADYAVIWWNVAAYHCHPASDPRHALMGMDLEFIREYSSVSRTLEVGDRRARVRKHAVALGMNINAPSATFIAVWHKIGRYRP